MIAIIGLRYRKYTHYTLHGSCPHIYGIAIVRLLLFLFLAHLHESANICVAIKSGSSVCEMLCTDSVYCIILGAAEPVCTSTQWRPTYCEPSGLSGDMTTPFAVNMILLIISSLS